MTLRAVLLGWAITHRDEAIERVEFDRGLVLTLRRHGEPSSVLEAQLVQYRDERSVLFWDRLVTRLAPRPRARS